ncbi:MAG TPA: amidohydrolase family protein [Candidatus Hydrogenedentes bacterium]|nr:amidohydrolase family protein [Candidatus Hydrogenedentota bacterium]HPG66941.1 amidohydrolase family protein [Candidatus Hydrogenedentota bacterium]
MPSENPKKRGRRTFLKVCGAGAVVAGLSVVYIRTRKGPEVPKESMGALEPSPNAPCPEAALRPPHIEDLGIRRMSELDRLPWFVTNEAGDLCLRPDAGIGPIIDTHSHVGWAYGLARSVDMTRTCKVQYFYDYEREQDLLFTQDHPTPEEGKAVTREGIQVFLRTPERNRTNTAANLSLEMDRLNYRNIVLLPIEIPHQARHAHDTLEAAKLDSRFIGFGAIHPTPWGPEKIAQLESQRELGIKGIKYHPEMQLIAPDHPDMMSLCEWCQANHLIVYAHVGYTGREPGFMRSKSEPRLFEKPLQAFPSLRIVLAHTGVRLMDETLEVARKYEDQVWLDISGRSASNITYILQRYDTEKIMYASDWPFMPLAVMVARGLVATEACPQLRDRFFRGNAARLLELA